MKKKLILFLFLISSSAWSASCTEYASLLVVLKLRDMLTGISDTHYSEISDSRDATLVLKNRFTLPKFCKSDDIEDTIVSVRKERFKPCKLRSIEASLDLPENSLDNERIVTIVSDYTSEDDCSHSINTKAEDNIAAAVRSVNRELSKERPNITKVCNFAREAFKKNDDLFYSCR